MSRILAKLSSVCALCTLVMVLTLCILALRQPEFWQKLFEASLMFLLGNYVGRNVGNRNSEVKQ